MTTKKEQTEQQKVRNEALKKIGMIVISLLFIVNTIQLARLGGVVERVDIYNKGVVDEIGGVRQDVITFATDLNEIRQFLLLPTKQYSFGKNQNPQTDEPAESTSSRIETAIFSFLEQETDSLNFQENAKIAVEKSKALIADANFNQQLGAAGLKNMPLESNELSESFKIADDSGTPIFSIIFDKKHNQVKVQSALGSYDLKPAKIDDMAAEIVKYCLENKQKAADLKNLINKQKVDVAALAKDTGINEILSSQKLSFSSTATESEESINYNFLNKDQESLITIEISRKDGQLNLLNNQTNQFKTYSDTVALTPDLTAQLKNLDTASAEQRLINQRKVELEKIFEQESFKELLANSSLTLDKNPRDEANKVLYDVKNPDGKTIFSFAIEKSSGLFKIIKDNSEIDLYSTISDDGSKKKT